MTQVVISFKTPRLAEEWAEVHPVLRVMVYRLAAYAVTHLSVSGLMVTCLYRTPDEQREAYNLPADAKPPRSMHCEVPIRAVDIRRVYFSKDKIDALRGFWNRERPPVDGFDFVDEPGKHHIHLEIDHKADAWLADNGSAFATLG